jgi:hypothetical protein
MLGVHFRAFVSLCRRVKHQGTKTQDTYRLTISFYLKCFPCEVKLAGERVGDPLH